MKNLTLSENEINEMISFYSQELEKAKQRIAHITHILKKLMSKEEYKTALLTGFEGPETIVTHRGRKRGAKRAPENEGSVPVIVPKKRGRKPKPVGENAVKAVPGRKTRKGATKKEKSKRIKWTSFILDTLREKDSLLLANSITHIAMEKYKIAPEGKEKIRLAVANCLARLANVEKKVITYNVKEIRGRFYALPEWFDENGVLKEEYTGKLK